MKRLIFLTTFFACVSGSMAFEPDMDAIRIPSLLERYPLGTIYTPQTAEEALDAVSRARSDSERYEKLSVGRCQENFLVNRCVDQIRRARLEAEKSFIAIEVEAKRVIREKNKADAAARQVERERKAAAGPRDVKSGSSHGTAGKGELTTQTERSKRIRQTEARKREAEERRLNEAQNQKAYDARLVEYEKRVKKREEALKKRALKKAEAAKKNKSL